MIKKWSHWEIIIEILFRQLVKSFEFKLQKL